MTNGRSLEKGRGEAWVVRSPNKRKIIKASIIYFVFKISWNFFQMCQKVLLKPIWMNKRGETKIPLSSVIPPKSSLVSNRVCLIWLAFHSIHLSEKVICTCFLTVHTGKRWITHVSLVADVCQPALLMVQLSASFRCPELCLKTCSPGPA